MKICYPAWKKRAFIIFIVIYIKANLVFPKRIEKANFMTNKTAFSLISHPHFNGLHNSFEKLTYRDGSSVIQP